MSAIEELSSDRLRAVLERESRAVLVDFWSPWCAPCRTLRPHLERLAAAHATSMRFVAVDIEADAAAGERFGVRSLPTVAIYRDGEELERFGGAAVLSGIAAYLEAAQAPGRD